MEIEWSAEREFIGQEQQSRLMAAVTHYSVARVWRYVGTGCNGSPPAGPMGQCIPPPKSSDLSKFQDPPWPRLGGYVPTFAHPWVGTYPSLSTHGYATAVT